MKLLISAILIICSSAIAQASDYMSNEALKSAAVIGINSVGMIPGYSLSDSKDIQRFYCGSPNGATDPNAAYANICEILYLTQDGQHSGEAICFLSELAAQSPSPKTTCLSAQIFEGTAPYFGANSKRVGNYNSTLRPGF
jgi:hypothetical protein